MQGSCQKFENSGLGSNALSDLLLIRFMKRELDDRKAGTLYRFYLMDNKLSKNQNWKSAYCEFMQEYRNLDYVKKNHSEWNEPHCKLLFTMSCAKLTKIVRLQKFELSLTPHSKPVIMNP